jgi:hypothetical protein
MPKNPGEGSFRVSTSRPRRRRDSPRPLTPSLVLGDTVSGPSMVRRCAPYRPIHSRCRLSTSFCARRSENLSKACSNCERPCGIARITTGDDSLACVSGLHLRIISALLAAGALSLGTDPSAHAGAAAAQVCAAKLSPEAQTIYNRAAPSVTPTTDLPNLLKSTVPGLVFEGEVHAATARESATAAYPCLKDLT